MTLYYYRQVHYSLYKSSPESKTRFYLLSFLESIYYLFNSIKLLNICVMYNDRKKPCDIEVS